MAIPTKKTEEIERLCDSVTTNKKGRRGAILSDECSFCCGPAKVFQDSLSREEFSISGLCQSCQDKTFGKEEQK